MAAYAFPASVWYQLLHDSAFERRVWGKLTAYYRTVSLPPSMILCPPRTTRRAMPAGAQPHNFILSSIHLRKLYSALVALASGAEEHCFIETGGQDTGERPG